MWLFRLSPDVQPYPTPRFFYLFVNAGPLLACHCSNADNLNRWRGFGGTRSRMQEQLGVLHGASLLVVGCVNIRKCQVFSGG